MAKDPSKYRYFHVGILLDSETLEDIKQDLKDSHIEDQPNKLLALRIAEYYRLVRRGSILPGITARMQQDNGNGHSKPIKANQRPHEEERADEDDNADAVEEEGDNVDASADYWTTLQS